MTTRREIIAQVYRERQGPAFQGMDPLAHWLIRRYIIRPRLRAAGISLLPLKFTSIRFPRTFTESVQLYRLRSGIVGNLSSLEAKMEANAAADKARSRERYRRSRMAKLAWKMHRWDESNSEEPKVTLWQLAFDHGGIAHPASPLFERVKEIWSTTTSSGREAIEQAISEAEPDGEYAA